MTDTSGLNATEFLTDLVKRHFGCGASQPTTVNCIRCGKEFKRKGRKKYCTQCSNIVYKESQAKYRAKN